jgi:hypothetical protein
VKSKAKVTASRVEVCDAIPGTVSRSIGDYVSGSLRPIFREALAIAIKLTDEFYRDAALHATFDFCMKAKDLKFATIIAKAITVDMIQEKIVEEYPEYFTLNERDGRLHPTAAAALGPLLK